jgi:CIC family chloride channel protein
VAGTGRHGKEVTHDDCTCRGVAAMTRDVSPGGRLHVWTTRWLPSIKDASYIRKWLILGTLIGVVAGLGAVAFINATKLATHLFLNLLAGYQPPLPLGEGNISPAHGFVRPWAIPLVVGLGGLIAGGLATYLAPEAEGHGTDAAIAAFHHNPRGVRARVSLVKIAASAITIGSGGSAGREGPTAQISASFGSILARRLDLTPADARIAIAVGIGSGIGAIFRAPLGGAVLGAEILYREDVESDALMPSILASIIGFSIFGAVEGFEPIFGSLQGYTFNHPMHLLAFALLGVLAGLVGRLYATVFYWVHDNSKRLPGTRMIHAAVGGLLVGLIGLVAPPALGSGYGFVQQAMTAGITTMPLWIILALPLVKILATSLSIGTGGSGGIFGPGMVIGAFLGAGVWRLLTPMVTGLPDNPAPFMVVGMVACFGSISHAVLAVMLMVAEMTGTLALLPPAMIALALAVLVVGPASIYRAQLTSRIESPAHRFRLALPILASVRAAEAMAEPRRILDTTTTLQTASGLLDDDHLPGAPVVDASGRFVGVVRTAEVCDAVHAGRTGTVAEVADARAPTTSETSALDAAIELLATHADGWLSVLDQHRRVVGIIGMTEIIHAYRRALRGGLRQLKGVGKSIVLLEEQVGHDSQFVGRQLRQTPLPPGAVVISVQRNGQLIFPRASTTIEQDDLLSVIADTRNADGLTRQITGNDRDDAV